MINVANIEPEAGCDVAKANVARICDRAVYVTDVSYRFTAPSRPYKKTSNHSLTIQKKQHSGIREFANFRSK